MSRFYFTIAKNMLKGAFGSLLFCVYNQIQINKIMESNKELLNKKYEYELEILNNRDDIAELNRKFELLELQFNKK